VRTRPIAPAASCRFGGSRAVARSTRTAAQSSMPRARSVSRTAPDPKLQHPTDAVIRMSATCVCGSDLWDYRGINPVSQPTPMGHEYVGIVEEVGSEVTAIGRAGSSSARSSPPTTPARSAGPATSLPPPRVRRRQRRPSPVRGTHHDQLVSVKETQRTPGSRLPMFTSADRARAVASLDGRGSVEVASPRWRRDRLSQPSARSSRDRAYPPI
jgi:hypothetical protein